MIPARGLLRGGLAAVRARLRPSFRRPLGVYLCLTSRCDGACRYCRFPELHATAPREFSTAETADLIDELAAAGTVKLNLTGGEPLLHPGLPTLLARARARGLFTVVSTNGLRLADRAAAVRDAAVVMVSVDGRPDHHDAMRGAGSHARVLAGLAALAAQGTRFWLTAVITAATLDDDDYLLDLARRYQTVVNFVLPNFTAEPVPESHLPAAAAAAGWFPEPNALRTALARLLARQQAGEPIGSTAPYLRLLLAWPDYRELRSARPGGCRCWAGRLSCHLYPNRRLYACGQLFGTNAGVPFAPGGFAAAFARLAAPPDCRSCRVGCELENNLIYSLHPGAIGNWLRRLRNPTRRPDAPRPPVTGPRP